MITATEARATLHSLLLLLSLAAGAASPADYETVAAMNSGHRYAEAYRALAPVEADPGADPRLVRLLGEAYQGGRGVRADPARAVQLFQRAALAGDGIAAVHLGTMYESGDGLPKDPNKAFEWYARAASTEPDAAFKYASALLANPGLTPSPDSGAAIERLEFAARGDHKDAQRLLGALYLEGRVVAKDPAAAQRWLEATGDDTAETHRQLGILYTRSPEPEARARGLDLLRRAYQRGDWIAAAYLGLYAERAATNEAQKKMALEYYRVAKPAGIAWADEGAARLEAHLRSIELLGMKIQGTRRAELQRHLAALGIAPVRSEPGVYDAYVSERLASGSQSITILYAPGPDQFVAEVAYRYSADELKARGQSFGSLRGRLDGIYGRHQPGAGERIAQWRVDDADVTLKTVDGPSTLLLVYRFQPYAEQLAQAIATSHAANAPAAGSGP
jgi:TPR repeat protein